MPCVHCTVKVDSISSCPSIVSPAKTAPYIPGDVVLVIVVPVVVRDYGSAASCGLTL